MADKAIGHGDLKRLLLADVIPSAANPRIIRKDDPKLAELTESIKALGVLVPVLVRPKPGDPGKWELLAGSRRRAAAKAAGLTELPVLVRELDDRAALVVIVTENMQREDLSPFEEARGVRALLDGGFSVKEAAAELGRSGSWIVRRAQLTKLAEAWQRLVADPEQAPSRWPAAWLEQIAALAEEAQTALLEHWTAEGWLDDNAEWEAGMIEQEIGQLLHELKRTPWKMDSGTLSPKDPPCYDCPQRSSRNPGLFDELEAPEEQAKANDRCLNAACWDRKRAAFIECERERLAVKHGLVLLVSRGYGSQVPEGAVNLDQVAEISKKREGAVPCLRVDGPGAGTHFWGIALEGRSVGSKPKPVDERGKPIPTPIEERRKQLGFRREALVNGWLKEHLLDEDEPPKTPGKGKLEVLVRLAAAFGTAKNAADRDADEVLSDERHGGWPALRNEKQPAARLWADVCGVLARRLSFFPPVSNVPVEEHAALGDLLDLDLAALRAKAAEEIPEPKSWAKINRQDTRSARGKKAEAEEPAADAATFAEPEQSSPPRHKDTKKTSATAEKTAEAKKPVPGVCRICGCTETTPCLGINIAGEACAWADRSQTLCTNPDCLRQAKKKAEPPTADAATFAEPPAEKAHRKGAKDAKKPKAKKAKGRR